MAIVFLLAGARASSAVPTIEDYAANDVIESPLVSPDGSMIAYLNCAGRDVALAIYHLDTGKGEVLCKVDSRTSGFSWKGNDRILFFENFGSYGYLRCASPGKTTLNKFPGYGPRRTIPSVVDWLPGDDGHILVRTSRLAIMDALTGDITETAPTDDEKFAGPYIHDRSGALRLRCVQRRDGIELQQRHTDADPFVTVHSWSWDDPHVYFEGFAQDPEVSYLLTETEGDWGELRPLNTRTSEIGPAIAKGNGAQLMGAVFSRDHSRLIGLKVSDSNGTTVKWTDDTMRRRQASVDAALVGRDNTIVSASLDASSLIILSQLNAEPGVYFSLDARRGTLKRLGAKHPQIDPASLAKPRMVEIKARDGLDIHGVFATPASAQGPCPLVILLRPDIFENRSGTRFFLLQQFLVSRGYSVLVVDYRGSRGYGKSYEYAGRHQFARKIPDDVEDAARWALAGGMALKDRICLFGIDSGATVALIEATRTPELYSCVVNEDGEPDLRDIAHADGENWLRRKSLELYYSDDNATLAGASALAAIGKLRGPILNIYVDVNHNPTWGHLRSALRSANKTYVEFKDLDPDAEPMELDYRENYLRQVDEFLRTSFPAGG